MIQKGGPIYLYTQSVLGGGAGFVGYKPAAGTSLTDGSAILLVTSLDPITELGARTLNANADNVGTTFLNGLVTLGLGYVWDGTNWDRRYSLPSDSDDQSDNQIGLAGTVSRNYAYNGTEWDRIRSQGTNIDDVDPLQRGALAAASFLYALNTSSSSWDRLQSEGDTLDGLAPNSSGRLAVVAHNAVFNGTNWDRKRSASALEQGNLIHVGVQASASVGNWALSHAPAANTAAIVTRGAGSAGVCHICTSIHASINAVAAIAAPLTLVLRDGTSGAGAILWQDRMTAVLGTTDKISISGLSIVGSPNTAMTLEFTGAPGATSFETVALTGYSVS